MCGFVALCEVVRLGSCFGCCAFSRVVLCNALFSLVLRFCAFVWVFIGVMRLNAILRVFKGVIARFVQPLSVEPLMFSRSMDSGNAAGDALGLSPKPHPSPIILYARVWARYLVFLLSKFNLAIDLSYSV